MTKKADYYRSFKLVERVLTALQKNTRMNQEEREVELESEQRKQQIDSFFKGLKEKVATEKEAKSDLQQKQKIKEELRKKAQEVRNDEFEVNSAEDESQPVEESK